MIPFNRPTLTGNEQKHVLESINSLSISGDGQFTKQCHQWFEKILHCSKALLTTSCTHALEMSAILLDIQVGDEVIMPSYTFVNSVDMINSLQMVYSFDVNARLERAGIVMN